MAPPPPVPSPALFPQPAGPSPISISVAPRNPLRRPDSKRLSPTPHCVPVGGPLSHGVRFGSVFRLFRAPRGSRPAAARGEKRGRRISRSLRYPLLHGRRESDGALHRGVRRGAGLPVRLAAPPRRPPRGDRGP